MGGCQNDGPFLEMPYYHRDPKGDQNFENHPYGPEFGVQRPLRARAFFVLHNGFWGLKYRNGTYLALYGAPNEGFGGSKYGFWGNAMSVVVANDVRHRPY